MSDIQFRTASDAEILEELGERLKGLRETKGLTQKEAAKRAGIGRDTLYRTEHGQNPTLQTVIRLLRAYGRLEALESFIPRPEISPMARLRARQQEE